MSLMNGPKCLAIEIDILHRYSQILEQLSVLLTIIEFSVGFQTYFEFKHPFLNHRGYIANFRKL